jgi:hypothetical protein
MSGIRCDGLRDEDVEDLQEVVRAERGVADRGQELVDLCRMAPARIAKQADDVPGLHRGAAHG